VYMLKENMAVQNVIDTIISDLKGNSGLADGLLSLVLHGGAPLFEDGDRYLDVDIIFLYKDNAIPIALREIKKTFSALCHDLNKVNNKAFFAIKSGPMHPLREKETEPLFNINNQRIIFFHISVFSESDYTCKNTYAAPSPLLAYRWQNLKPAFGQPLSVFRSIDKITVDDIIVSGLGIDDTIFMLTNKERGCWVWESGDMVWHKEPFKDFDDYEMAVYALKWCVNNSLSYLSQILPIKLTEERRADAFAIHFLKQPVLADYYSIIGFEANIKNYRKQFVENPASFRKLFDIKKLTEIVIFILHSAKEKLQLIQKISNHKYKLPNFDKEIPICCNSDLKKLLKNAVSKKDYDRIVLITDGNVAEFYDLKPWIAEWKRPFVEYVIKGDIGDKSPKKLLEILKFLEKSGISTESLLILFGGGSVGNMGGMAAGLCFRGVDFIHVPTTLLSQLDSSIGCKQSVNGFISKNKFGLFHAPESINISILFNDTLSKKQLQSGLVEALKHGLCQSKKLVKDVAAYGNRVCDENYGDLVALENIILRTIEFKLQYMKLDPFEKSPNQHLELGHKIGHAIEFATKEKIPHGICVAFGIIAEAKFFAIQNAISPQFMQSLTNYVKGIVTNIDDLHLINNTEIINKLFLDNKIKKNKIPLVLLKTLLKPESVFISLDSKSTEIINQSLNYAKEVFGAN